MTEYIAEGFYEELEKLAMSGGQANQLRKMFTSWPSKAQRVAVDIMKRKGGATPTNMAAINSTIQKGLKR